MSIYRTVVMAWLFRSVSLDMKCESELVELAPILANLKILNRLFAFDDFKIDEKPFEIVELAAEGGKLEASEASGLDRADRSAKGSVRTADVIELDLISSLSLLIEEKNRLKKLAEEVQPASQSDDEFGRFAHEAILFIDGLDRVAELAREQEHVEGLSGWVKTIQALYDRVLKLFEKYGLEVLNCRGQTVDFNVHDVIEYRRTRDHPHNTVIQEIRKGIVFRNRTIRDAKVVVACNED